MIANDDPNLYILIEPDGPGRTERHRVRAWDSADGTPQVLDRRGGLVGAHTLGRVRGVEGNDR